MKNPNYQVINASAGSGKTYTIVKQLLANCLAEKNNASVLQSVLALTFTNKAANEMKQRILDNLLIFSNPDNYLDCKELISVQEYLKELEKEISLKELHHRAIQLKDYLLHHYSILQISTLDRFNTRLVRSFAYELGLEPSFSIDIDISNYLIQAMDNIFAQIGNNPKLTNVLWDYFSFIKETANTNTFKKNLLLFGDEFSQEINYFRLKENADFSWNSYDDTNKYIDNRLQQIKFEMFTLCESALQLKEDNNLLTEEFSGKKKSSIITAFLKIRNHLEHGDVFPLEKNEEKKIISYEKGFSSVVKDKAKQQLLLDLAETFIEKRAAIITLFIESCRLNLLKRFMLPMILNNKIQQELQMVLEDNNAVLLSKFNVLIHENLENESTDFLYEKVGQRFQLYYLDEFQDTSGLQWENIIPLRNDTISTEGSQFTLVGDPKQSIYRFRGGESKIFIDIINKN